ncbi:thioredoxin family protein [Bacillus daqingensis]|uniref:Thioredoxin family protein n=1 Tax=Bacillus daqingensis TaxID=872396 RepID=A0ABV9NSH5_9BACI
MTEFTYFYTPVCGTCKLAERFVDIAEQLPGTEKVSRLDINEHPDLAQKWQITSVPCLMKVIDGQPEDRMYAFRDVPRVVQFIQKSKGEHS